MPNFSSCNNSTVSTYKFIFSLAEVFPLVVLIRMLWKQYSLIFFICLKIFFLGFYYFLYFICKLKRIIIDRQCLKSLCSFEYFECTHLASVVARNVFISVATSESMIRRRDLDLEVKVRIRSYREFLLPYLVKAIT